jgi:hypothetical protein
MADPFHVEEAAAVVIADAGADVGVDADVDADVDYSLGVCYYSTVE